jgi:DNA-binding MarR family transcriptional regulator
LQFPIATILCYRLRHHKKLKSSVSVVTAKSIKEIRTPEVQQVPPAPHHIPDFRNIPLMETSRIMKYKSPELDRAIGAMFHAYKDVSHKETFFYISRNAKSTPLCNGDLAELMGVKPSTISNRINTLMKQGLVISSPDPTRRRNQILTLTTVGEALAQNLIDSAKDLVTAETLVGLRHRLGISLEGIERAENRLILEDKRNSNAD